MAGRLDRYGDETVIAPGHATLGLLGLDHADEATKDEAAGRDRFVQQHKYIERITVTIQGSRHHAEVVREHCSGGQHTPESEHAVRLVVVELVPAALRRLDDHMYVACARIHWRNSHDSSHRSSILPPCSPATAPHTRADPSDFRQALNGSTRLSREGGFGCVAAWA